MIDLHLHTTASDGLSSPAALVNQALAAGVTTLAVTDHDTTAAVADVAAAARRAGLAALPGIEITSVLDGRDLHILGYFLDPAHAALEAFLARQREDRRRRILEMAARLERLGAPIDTDLMLLQAGEESGQSVGRPLLAAALVGAGHARDIADAFDRYLAHGRPAFIERVGASPGDVIALIAAAGGLASLAHPGKLGLDAFVAPLAADGLAAIEAFHPDHAPADTRRYQQLARDHGMLVTGGSDYHGAGSGRVVALGRIGLPAEEFSRLADRAGWSAGA